MKSNTFTQVDKDNLNKALGACAVVQRTYGKQVADLKQVVKIFIKVLDGFEPEQVVQAIKQWLMQSPEFPTPSDILKILKPQPIYDKNVYMNLKNKIKNFEFISITEKEYIESYERYVVNSIKQ